MERDTTAKSSIYDIDNAGAAKDHSSCQREKRNVAFIGNTLVFEQVLGAGRSRGDTDTDDLEDDCNVSAGTICPEVLKMRWIDNA